MSASLNITSRNGELLTGVAVQSVNEKGEVVSLIVTDPDLIEKVLNGSREGSLCYQEPKQRVRMIGDMAFIPSYAKSSEELGVPCEALLEELLAVGIVTKENWKAAAKPIALFVAKAMQELAQSIKRASADSAESVYDELTPAFQCVSSKWLEKMGAAPTLSEVVVASE